MKDLLNKLNVKPAFEPKAAVADNTAFVSTIFDMQGHTSAMLAIVTGTDADADATFTMLLEESNVSDMTGAAAVADADMNGTEALASYTFANDFACRKLGYVGGKRYIRATVTPSGNTGNAFLAGVWLGTVDNAPPANPPV